MLVIKTNILTLIGLIILRTKSPAVNLCISDVPDRASIPLSIILGGSNAEFQKLVEVHPGFPNNETEDLENLIECIYCNQHAKNTTKKMLRRHMKGQRTEKEKWKRQKENKKKQKAEDVQPQTVKRKQEAELKPK